MLGKIIALYKAVFLVWCALLLVTVTVLGLIMIIEGATPAERRSGFGVLIGGAVFVLFIAGNFALVLENNELLRRIANSLEGQNQQDQPERQQSSARRSNSGFTRREPII